MYIRTVCDSDGLMDGLGTAVFTSTLVQYKPVLCCGSRCVVVMFIESRVINTV